jgi:hypothetical protein
MDSSSKITITAEETLVLIKAGENICNRSITGTLRFEMDEFHASIVLENCEVESLFAASASFYKPVRFINCQFINKCDFAFCYFLSGLEIKNSVFNSYLDFQCGGHNKPPTSFLIVGTEFNDFVNFFDCQYDGPVIITGNIFEQGTNLLGNQNKPYAVLFNDVVTIEANKGILNFDNEGGDGVVPEPTNFPIILN